MKNINTILNVVLGIAVVVLSFFVFKINKSLSGGQVSDSKKPTSDIISDEKVESVDSILSKSKVLDFPIAYVNIDTIAEKFEYFKQQRKSLETSYTAKINQLTARQKQIESEFARIQKEIQDGTTKLVTTEDIQRKEMEFQQKAQDLYMENQKIEDEHGKASEKLIDGINKSIDEFLKKYKENMNYSYVFQKGGMVGAPLLYADERLDITDDVLKALNIEYAAKTKK
jgi:outer membrane protein